MFKSMKTRTVTKIHYDKLLAAEIDFWRRLARVSRKDGKGERDAGCEGGHGYHREDYSVRPRVEDGERKFSKEGDELGRRRRGKPATRWNQGVFRHVLESEDALTEINELAELKTDKYY